MMKNDDPLFVPLSISCALQEFLELGPLELGEHLIALEKFLPLHIMRSGLDPARSQAKDPKQSLGPTQSNHMTMRPKSQHRKGTTTVAKQHADNDNG